MLFIGMSWFEVFKSPPLYMAAFAFSAYGIHWFAIGYNRAHGNDSRPNVGMCVAYFLISALGAVVFFLAGDWPVGWLFIGLVLIYISDFFASLGSKTGVRALGFWHLLTGIWLMYLMIATALNFSNGLHLPL